MKKAFLMVAVSAAVLTLPTSDAAADWYCEARSNMGYGWGKNWSLRAARARALAECAKRTYRDRVCHIVFCDRTNR